MLRGGATGDETATGGAAKLLARARAVHTRLRGLRGKERAAVRREAVEAYREVRRRFPLVPQAAEAAFRAGELLRAGGEVRAALSEFRFARGHEKGGEFRARAGLEIGHSYRRARRLLDALEAYEAVGADARASRRYRDAAWLWAGRVQARLGRAPDAIRAWRRVAEGDGDVFDRLRAYDKWGLALIDAGDLEGAAGVLESCRKSFRERALEKSEHGERLRAALGAMRVIPALEAAIAARRTSGGSEGGILRKEDARRDR